jgi:hypothetical protein
MNTKTLLKTVIFIGTTAIVQGKINEHGRRGNAVHLLFCEAHFSNLTVAFMS